jgi:hypothetical protein
MKPQLSKLARRKARYSEEYKQEALELWRAVTTLRWKQSALRFSSVLRTSLSVV